MKNKIGLLLLSALVAGSAGCASKITVSKVEKDELKPVMPEKGVYYTLPKTAVDIEIPFYATVTRAGKYGDYLDDYVKECKGKPSSAKIALKDIEANDNILIKSIDVNTVSIRDIDHMYRLDVDLDWFSDFKHTVKLSKDGILTNVNASSKNSMPEMVTELVKFTAKSIPVFALYTVDNIPDIRTPATCSDIISTKSLLDEYERELKSIDAKLIPLVDEKRKILTSSGLKSEPDVIDKSIQYIDKEISEKKKKLTNEMQNRLGKIKMKEIKQAIKEASFLEEEYLYILSTRVIPNEFSAFDSGFGSDTVGWILKKYITEKNTDGEKITRLEIISKNSPEYNTLVSGQNYYLSILPLINIDNGSSEKAPVISEDKNSTDLRYRLPAFAQIKIGRKEKGKDGKPDQLEQLYSSEKFIAQYGPIAFIPTDFNGAEGSIDLSLYPETGGVEAVTIKTTPISPEEAGGLASASTDALVAINNREITELEQKKKLLELKKAVKNLEDEASKEASSE